MKLKCNDGVTRSFKVAKPSWRGVGYDPAECEFCGYDFDVHDTRLLKAKFREHVCTFKCKHCGWKGTDYDINLFGEPRCPNCFSGDNLVVCQ